MRLLILFIALSSLIFCQNDWQVDEDKTNIAFLIVDYDSLVFEGGSFQKFDLIDSNDSLSIPIDYIYNSPYDYGNIMFYYQSTTDSIFAGDIWWAGLGSITYPDTIDNENLFYFDSTSVREPDSLTYYNIQHVIEDSTFKSKADSVWQIIDNLSVLKKFSDEKNHFYAGIYLYAPAVGVFDARYAKWIIFIYSSNKEYSNVSQNKTPTEFKLYQNYPNPFNPSTNIEFEINKSQNIKLTILDVLGREKEVLINKYLQAGRYKVNFNAEKYSAGVYFYNLSFESKSETRKMILIK